MSTVNALLSFNFDTFTWNEQNLHLKLIVD
jgi:hypothetical protein